MTFASCNDCGAQVNTAEDPDCFITVGNMRRMTWEIIVCESCRWIRADDEERQQHELARAEAAAEAVDAAGEVYK